MPFLTKRRQVAAKVEGTRGTAETLVAADNIPRIRLPANFTTTPFQVERNLATSAVTRAPKLVPGSTQVQFTFGVELGGHPDNPTATYTVPGFDTLLQGCALESLGLRRWVLGAITGGPFRSGELVTQDGGTGAQNWEVFGDTWTDHAEMYITIGGGSGTPNENEVTGATSGATVTPSSTDTNVYRGWRPRSDVTNMPTLTIAMYIDGQIVKAHGCMGTVDFQLNHGDAIVAQFTFTGILTSVSDGALLSGATLDSAQNIPPTFFGSTMDLRDGSGDIYGAGSLRGPLNQMTLSLANSVTLRTNSIALADGYDFALISDREPTFSFNPDAVVAADYDYFASQTQGTINRMTMDVGTAAGNRFRFNVPGIQFNGLGDGDREGVMTLDATADLTGGYYGASPNLTPGLDNELILIYR